MGLLGAGRLRQTVRWWGPGRGSPWERQTLPLQVPWPTVLPHWHPSPSPPQLPTLSHPRPQAFLRPLPIFLLPPLPSLPFFLHEAAAPPRRGRAHPGSTICPSVPELPGPGCSALPFLSVQGRWAVGKAGPPSAEPAFPVDPLCPETQMRKQCRGSALRDLRGGTRIFLACSLEVAEGSGRRVFCEGHVPVSRPPSDEWVADCTGLPAARVEACARSHFRCAGGSSGLWTRRGCLGAVGVGPALAGGC